MLFQLHDCASTATTAMTCSGTMRCDHSMRAVSTACCDEVGECELLTLKAEEADKLQVEADGGASDTDQGAAAEADTPSGSS